MRGVSGREIEPPFGLLCSDAPGTAMFICWNGLRPCLSAAASGRRRPASAMRVQSDEAGLREIVQRIVDVAHPERVILFGSSARGEAGPHSDMDMLVIVKPGTHRRRLTFAIYRRLSELGRPVDVVVATSEDIDRYGDCPALVYAPALREGRVVYDG